MKKFLNMEIFWAFLKRRDVLFLFLSLLLFAGFLFLSQKTEKTFSTEITNQTQKEKLVEIKSVNVSPLSGLKCETYNRRPIAVMIANDNVARPLSGLSEADMVFEMQVVEDGITRLMAVFICGSPKEIGSVRSARHDFIPLAMGLDAIYAHWGGSHFALDLLRNKIINNIDALTNPFNAFYRTNNISPPHNGFTSIERLLNSASKLGYRLENKFEGYKHQEAGSLAIKKSKNGRLKISYTKPYNVDYEYVADRNSYLRNRGGKPEIDKNNGKQVEVKNVVVMRAKSRPLEGQYNDVEVEGEGKVTVYQNGEEIKGFWRKDKNNAGSKLYFYNESGEEIRFVPGQIWVEIIEPEKVVEWITNRAY